MADAPAVSVGLPVYNGERYLAPAIESILAQTYGDLELLLCDNASTDATEEICRRYADADPRVRYVRHPENLGAAENYNGAFRLARGRYFRWAAHDDLLEPRHLERCTAELDAAPESVVLCYPRTVLVDGEGRPLRVHEDRMDLREEHPYQRLRHVVRVWSLCNPIFGLIRREALARTGLIRKFVSSDVVLLCELALLGGFREVPEPLFLRRIHEDTSRRRDVSLREVARWFDPQARGQGFLHPRTRLFFRVLELVWNAELPPAERARCLATTTQAWWWRRFRVRAGRVRRRLLPDRSGATPG